MAMAHKLRVAIGLALLAIAIATATGCGGPAKLSRAEAISQADRICARIEARRTALTTSLSGLSTSKQLKEIARTAPAFAQVQYEGVQQLRAIKRPAPLAHDWRELLEGMQQLAANTAKVGIAAGQGSGTGVETTAASGQPIRKRLEVIANRDGFKSCGR